MAFVNFYDVI